MRSHHRPFESAISFVQSDLVQSTGGSLLKLNDGFFYLVMGHVFAGRYADFEGQNETDGPKASQHYLGEIRKFRISGKPGAGNLHVEQVSSYSGPEFKRRDLNVVPTVLPDGKLGGAVYGGVFTGEQLSFTHPIYFSSSSAPRVDTAYEQKMSGYACARLLLFDRHANTMYTSFFGGISHWRWNHVSSQFETVPLVGSKTSNQYSDGMEWTDQITTLVHRSDSTSEFVQPENHLPGALGTEAVFFPAPGLEPMKDSVEIFDFDQFRGHRTFAGYIYGGIRAYPRQFPYREDSPAYRPGAVPTKASDQILKVYVTTR